MAPNAERTTQPLSLSLTLHLDPPLEASPGDLVDAIAERFDPDAGRPMGTWPTNSPRAWVSLTLPYRRPDHRENWPLAALLDELERAATGVLADRDLRGDVLGMEAITDAEVNRRIRERAGPPDVVGIDECCEILGQPGKPISRARFYELAKRDEFPTPMRRGVYFRAAMERYAAERHGAQLPRCGECGHPGKSHAARGGTPVAGAGCHEVWAALSGPPETGECPCPGYRPVDQHADGERAGA